MRLGITAIRARAEAATADMSSWSDAHAPEDGETVGYVPQGSHLGETLISLADTYENSREDCAFLAAARTDVPLLCDRVEALERVLEGLRLVGLSVVERADIPNAWAITNERAAKLEAALTRLVRDAGDAGLEPINDHVAAVARAALDGES